VNWEPHEGNKRRCPAHDEVFARTTTCSKCEPGKGAPLGAITPIDTDKDLSLLEGEFREAGKYLRRNGRDLNEEGTAQDKNTAIKFFEAALKYDRAALEIIKARKDREHDRWLVEQNRLLQGNGAA